MRIDRPDGIGRGQVGEVGLHSTLGVCKVQEGRVGTLYLDLDLLL